MPVRIKEILVKQLGPLDQFSMTPGIFNLIYGNNEKGKTYLVEFLVRSLFRNTRHWNLRQVKVQGKVLVEGLDNKTISFSFSSNTKFENFWEVNRPGLPPDFSRLLVVKGAKVQLSNESGGANRKIVYRYLSGQNLLDDIENKISPTIQKIQFQGDSFSGSNMGEIKKRDGLKEQLGQLDQLFKQIDRGYSGGYRQKLQTQKDTLNNQLAEQVKAKRFRAFQLNQEIAHLESQKQGIDEKKIQHLREDTFLYEKRITERNRKQSAMRSAQEKSQHFIWLQESEKTYENFLHETANRISLIFPILTVIMILALGIFIYVGISLGIWCALGGVILFSGLTFWKLYNTARNPGKKEELKSIEIEFQNRFNDPLRGLHQIKELLAKTREDDGEAKLLKKQLDQEINDAESLKLKIDTQIADLIKEGDETKAWDDLIRDKEAHLVALTNDIHQKDKLLASLNIDPSDYISVKTDVSYSSQKEKAIQDQLEEIKSEIRSEEEKLNTLKHLICQQTRQDIGTSWEILIQTLKEKYRDFEREYQQVTAEVLGKKSVFEVIQDLRKDEDKKIQEALLSKSIVAPLKSMTGRYHSIGLKDDHIYISDDYNDFLLSDLSTGAQEQVLLALRIGFATRFMGKEGDQLFLILDDAFQYSDWDRREKLMDSMVDLAKEGWQIFYFTMDDHIKKLFDAKGKQFGNQYVYKELN